MLPGRRQRIDFSRYFSDGYVHAAGRAEKLSTAVNAVPHRYFRLMGSREKGEGFSRLFKAVVRTQRAFVQLFGASSALAVDLL